MTSAEKNKILSGLLKELREGKDEEEVKKEFLSYFPDEKEALLLMKDAYRNKKFPYAPYEEEDNPLVIFAEENGALRALYRNIRIDNSGNDEVSLSLLKEETRRLLGLSLHYQKKEEVLFPYLRKIDFALLDERKKEDDALLKAIHEIHDYLLKENKIPHERISALYDKLEKIILDENRVLLPALEDHLKDSDLNAIKEKMDSYGYFLIRYPD